MEIITGRRPICAYISIVCTAICALAEIIGLLFVLWLSQGGNWGFVVLGILIIFISPAVLETIAIIFSIIAFARREDKRLCVVSIAISSVPLAIGTIMLIRALLI